MSRVAQKRKASKSITRSQKKRKQLMASHIAYLRGKFIGPFKRMHRVRRKNLYRRLGSEKHFELQGESVGTNVGEVGHSTCVPAEMMRSVGRAIVRRLFERVGVIISNWGVAPQLGVGYRYRIVHRTSPESSTVVVPALVAFTGSNYSDMADHLANTICALYTTGSDNVLLERAEIFYDTDTSVKEVNLRQCKLQMSVRSILTVQNSTSSKATGGSEFADDVRANPIIGRAFMTKSNTFIPISGSAEGFTNNVAIGTTGKVGDDTSSLTHPKPPLFYQNAKKTGQMLLQPGQIKKSSLKTSYKVYLNKFMRMYQRWLQDNAVVTASADVFVKQGVSKIFHFEHMVKHSGDASVTIPYELNVYIDSYIKYWTKREALRIDA
jgi:hypothetical protein